MISHDISSVAAVVVTYNPGEHFTRLMAALVPQTGAVWIIDNGSEEAGLRKVHDVAASITDTPHASAKRILNPENRGLAAAQNQGITAAMEAGFDWILLMDHDSIPAEDMVSQLLASAKNHPDPGSIGFMAPRHLDERKLPAAAVYACGPCHLLRRAAVGPGQVEDNTAFAMASGCLIPAQRFRDIGTMAEDFFIDYIDYDFSFRIRRTGRRIVTVGSACLTHRLGEAKQRSFLGRALRYREHPAWRRHTIYRNRVRVMLRHGLRFPELLQFEILSVAKDLLQIVFLESGKVAKLSAIATGIFDGLLGRGGVRRN